MPKKTIFIIKYGKSGKTINCITSELSTLVKNGLTITKSLHGIIVDLNLKNSTLIEALIAADPNYIPFAKYIFDYKFKLGSIPSYTDPHLKEKLLCVIREIDRDNNTNEWRFRKGSRINKVLDFICEPTNIFFDRLKKGDKKLVDDINALVGNSMPSLSSKICKYLSDYIFNTDSYFINDSYIRLLALFYYEYSFGVIHAKYKTISAINKLSYEDLFNLLELIRLKICPTLKREEFDHIIRYSYKSYEIK